MRIKHALLSLALLSAKDLCADDNSLISANPTLDAIMLSTSTVSSGKKEKECKNPLRPSQLVGRHWEGRGIGYSDGYSTIALFLTPKIDTFIPFADIRGHVFNNGKLAANVGVGARWMFPESCIAVGGNVFYDWRQTNRRIYNQIGAGVEAIGSIWDAHINGYLPVGNKVRRYVTSDRVTVGGGEYIFDGFEGHNMLLQLTDETRTEVIKRKAEFVMRGFEAGIGVQAVTMDNFSIRLAAGPYFFWGEFGKRAFGGKGEINLKWADCFSIGLWGSWDTLFNARTPWFLSLNIPFGPKKPKGGCQANLCSSPSSLNPMLFQGVDRFEMIVAHKKRLETKVIKTTFNGAAVAAIDPSTGSPYVFDFINNNSTGSLESGLIGSGPGSGTFENPFTSLAAAQSGSLPGDIIFVYPDDPAGGNPNLDTGIQLQNNQSLLGTEFSYTFATTQAGTVTVPPFTNTPTVLTNTASTFSRQFIVGLADNNTVSGLTMTDTNTIASPFDTVLVFNPGNTITFSCSNNIFNLKNGDSAMQLTNPTTVNILDNQFFSIDTTTANSPGGFFINTVSGQATIKGNTFGNSSGGGNDVAEAIALACGGSVGGTWNVVVENNTFTHIKSGSVAIFIENASISTSIFSGQITNNTFELTSTGGNTGIFAEQQTSSHLLCLNVNGNVESHSGGIAPLSYHFTGANIGPFQVNTFNLHTVNTFQDNGSPDPLVAPFTVGSCP